MHILIQMPLKRQIIFHLFIQHNSNLALNRELVDVTDALNFSFSILSFTLSV